MIFNFNVIILTLTVLIELTGSCTILANDLSENPVPISRTAKINASGDQIITTEILLDENTSREDLIHTCRFLAKEEVELTFESLNIRRSFLGIFGKKRIAQATGKIELPNGISEAFQVGGAISFQSIQITYSQDLATNTFAINTIEIID
ncbi:hypothetical protein [Tunicatimonas pelagia]|uniref:hypothetical protein n=1 Tax=Tunicatimonas pelagia TaxID=931531 RepID=UPI002666DBE0|nr:hypothetical protein [Tunicatimonas pelagia]WKN42167.1 hypothetical protein P0M28_24325 [Tunicatimonas pelagia]